MALVSPVRPDEVHTVTKAPGSYVHAKTRLHESSAVRCAKLQARSQHEPREAILEFQEHIEQMCGSSRGISIYKEGFNGHMDFKCVRCCYSFWHVLDIRFNHLHTEKGRADMLLLWQPEKQIWSNRKNTLNLTTQQLATYCVNRLLESADGHDCLIYENIITIA